jgi:hypothetical protein
MSRRPLLGLTCAVRVETREELLRLFDTLSKQFLCVRLLLIVVEPLRRFIDVFLHLFLFRRKRASRRERTHRRGSPVDVTFSSLLSLFTCLAGSARNSLASASTRTNVFRTAIDATRRQSTFDGDTTREQLTHRSTGDTRPAVRVRTVVRCPSACRRGSSLVRRCRRRRSFA